MKSNRYTCHFLIPRNSNTFYAIGEEFFVGQNPLTPLFEQNSLTSEGTGINLSFRLARDQVVLFKTAANLCANGVKQTVFSCFFFELGGITKLNDWPLSGKQNCFFAVIVCQLLELHDYHLWKPLENARRRLFGDFAV